MLFVLNNPSFTQHFELLPQQILQGIPLRLANGRVQAGFPSPAGDYMDQIIDLHEHLIRNPSATYLLEVKGDSMTGANIHEGDVLIVDCSEVERVESRIVVACLNGEFTVKRFMRKGGKCYLEAANPAYPTIAVPSDSDFRIWGVVQFIIHRA